MLTKQKIHEFLRSIGVKNNDTVLIHTSMRALGEVENGCDGLIDAFISYLSDGLTVIPTHTWGVVNAQNPVYDVRKTAPCIGALPTVASKRKDGIRSLHPTHSVWASGKRAVEFVSGEETACTPCPVGGVWSRLYDEHAKILLIGVGLNRNTYIHAIDERMGKDERLSNEPYEVKIIDYFGNERVNNFRGHGYAYSSNYGNYFGALLYHGAISVAKLGNAEVIVFDAVKGTRVIENLWQKADYDLVKEEGAIDEKYYK